MFIIISKIF